MIVFFVCSNFVRTHVMQLMPFGNKNRLLLPTTHCSWNILVLYSLRFSTSISFVCEDTHLSSESISITKDYNSNLITLVSSPSMFVVLVCCISLSLELSPVYVADGMPFELAAILSHIAGIHPTIGLSIV